MLLRDASFVVVDVETTGLSAAHNRITEIAMLRIENGKITDKFETLVNPEQYIPHFITQHTGISNAMVYGKPTFAEILPQVHAFMQRNPHSVLVGHNVSFDHGFVSQSYARAGVQFTLSARSGPNHLLCTCRLARRLLPSLQRRSLKHVQDYFGIRNSRQHRAMADAHATAQILVHFIRIAEEQDVSELCDFLKMQYAKTPVRKKPTKKQLSLRERVKEFPERPGVYTMTDRKDNILYVGKAKSLRDRVSSYFSESNTRGTKLQKMMRSVKEITYEETGSELSALLLESRKIKELKPQFNSMERRYRSYSFLKLDVQNPFPRMEMVREPSQDGADYYGPFRSADSVVALIDVLNRSFKLRECGDQFSVNAKNKPCFYHEIHRCNAPCAMRESRDDYRGEVERLRSFLAAGDAGVIAMVEHMMRDAAEKLDFEEAQFLKLRLIELKRVLGTGERTLASVNASDYVVLNQTVSNECEVLFVRFGRLIKQAVLNATHLANAEEWFFRQLRMYYAGVSAIPTACGKPEIDEMRILSHWTELRKRKGTKIIYIESNWEDGVSRMVRELRSLIASTVAAGPARPATTAEEVVKPTKRLKRTPMLPAIRA